MEVTRAKQIRLFPSLPKDLLDAAQIDGCGNLRFFFSIALPLSKAVIAVIALYIAVAQWNSYFNALVYIRNENLKPLQLVVRNVLATIMLYTITEKGKTITQNVSYK